MDPNHGRGHGEWQPTSLISGGSDSMKQQPTTLYGHPGERATGGSISGLSPDMKSKIIKVSKDLKSVREKVQNKQQRVLERQKHTDYVLCYGESANSVLQQDAQNLGLSSPPFLDPSQLERDLLRDLGRLEDLQQGLEGQAEASRPLNDSLQRSRISSPISEQLQGEFALFSRQQQKLQQQIMTLRSAYESLKDWNRRMFATAS